MALTLRFTAPSSDDRDWLDYTIVEDGRRDVGRLYEDRHSRPELRWFWSITVYINPNLGITTSGRAPTMNEAKEHFLRNWQKCRTVSSLARRPPLTEHLIAARRVARHRPESKIQIRTPGDRHLEESAEAGRVDGPRSRSARTGDTREEDDGGRGEQSSISRSCGQCRILTAHRATRFSISGG